MILPDIRLFYNRSLVYVGEDELKQVSESTQVGGFDPSWVYAPRDREALLFWVLLRRPIRTSAYFVLSILASERKQGVLFLVKSGKILAECTSDAAGANQET